MSIQSSRISDAYFTPPKSVTYIHSLLQELGWLKGRILEPCCGKGFLVEGLLNVTRWDMHQYDTPLDRQGDFLVQPPEPFDLVLTNPPFGFCNHTALKIFNHATKFSSRLAFVLPMGFRKCSRIAAIDRFYHPVLDVDIPDINYILPDGNTRKVKTCFQCWERRDTERIKLTSVPYGFFESRKQGEGDFYIRLQGATAGKILPWKSDYCTTTGAYVAGDRRIIEAHDWVPLTRMSSAAPTLGLHDIAWGLRSPNIKEYLKHGVMYDLIQGTWDNYTPTPTKPLAPSTTHNLEAFFV